MLCNICWRRVSRLIFRLVRVKIILVPQRIGGYAASRPNSVCVKNAASFHQFFVQPASCVCFVVCVGRVPASDGCYGNGNFLACCNCYSVLSC